MHRLPHEPLYRPVLRDAFRAAWEEKHYWWVALLAGLTLTGSVYDVGWRLMNAGAVPAIPRAVWGALWQRAVSVWSGFSLTDTILGGLKVFQLTAFFLIALGAVFVFSVIAQGALVYALGARHRGRSPKVKEALTVGARALWPVLVLNLFVVAILLAARGLLAIALSGAITNTTALAYLAYIVAFLAFAIISAAAVMLQVFALNAMLLQGATLVQALERGASLLAKHWVVAVEATALLFVITLGASFLAIAVNMLLGVPLFMLLILATVLQSKALLWLTLYTAVTLFVAVMLALGGCLIQLHYAAWTSLFRRFGEGGVIPKIHRWVRWLTHGYHVPGA